MDVYITVDMEGISGIAKPGDVLRGWEDYPRGQKLMIEDTNAVIEGAIEAGAEEIIVNDAHSGNWTNIKIEDLHDAAYLVRGKLRPKSQMQGISSDHDVAFFVGYHAMAGTANAVLNHTSRTTSIHELRVNDEAVGEIGFGAKYAASLGVPTGLVTGDDYTSKEAKNQLGDPETAIVKEAITRFSAKCKPLSEARQDLREAAKYAVKRAKDDNFNQPIPDEPTSMEIDWKVTDEAERAARIPSVEQVDDRTTRIEVDSYEEAFELTRTKTLLALTGGTNLFSPGDPSPNEI